ncbi:hypothetical protein FJM51_20910 [Amaricoccus solimangrovi]|uniref:Fenitrothion hydrolase n=1 Tax=Amaricoccus solimangrovi TaxID=2589815 RepID=A0A501WBK4_9RHOB|nr:hypothetical protein FJM51_20910 [Amaricoccus solimangrovi]
MSLALTPRAALAHAGGRMVILTLPTGQYILGAAAAVALTGVLGILGPSLPWPSPRLLLERRRAVPRYLPSWLSALTLFALIAAGFLGDRDPLTNPLSLTIWTFVWIVLPLVCLVLGDLGRAICPWSGPVVALRRAIGLAGGIGLSRLGAWPAVAGYLLIAWFELVSLAPSDPAVLARAVLGYWLVIFILAILEGETWLAHGEAVRGYLGFIGRVAPLWTETTTARVRHMLGPPGAQILAMPPLPPSGAAFVALMLAAVSFDGLALTFRWLALLGINPLEFPGRSAVILPNTLGLLAAWVVTFASILGAIWCGRRFTGARGAFGGDAGAWFLSFLPIAAGYHAAHHLVALLTDGQYLVASLDDPLGRGWNLLGLPENWVSFGFLTDRADVTLVWITQVALILLAHILAVILALRLASHRPIAHAPMVALMVLYTVFGLWLLSSPTAA